MTPKGARNRGAKPGGEGLSNRVAPADQFRAAGKQEAAGLIVMQSGA